MLILLNSVQLFESFALGLRALRSLPLRSRASVRQEFLRAYKNLAVRPSQVAARSATILAWREGNPALARYALVGISMDSF
jgi:hypothetical protein